jgi:Trypsin-like peptidase domain
MKRMVWMMLGIAATTAFADEADTARKALNNAVVRVTAEGREGAGIIVGSDDDTIFIATAKHVVGEAAEATVTFNAARHRSFPATVHKHSDCLDLAVVNVPLAKDHAVRSSLKPLRYRADRAPMLTVVSNIAHSADGWDPNFGVNKLQSERAYEIIFSSSDIVPGASGGPLFDDGNRLIGMVTQVGRSRATAVKMASMLEELSSWEVHTNLLTLATGSGTVTIDCSASRFAGCAIEVELVLGGVKAHVTKAGAKLTGVPLGAVSYQITGKTTCAGMQQVTGSGEVTIEKDVTLYLRARGGSGVRSNSGLVMLGKDLAAK